MTLERLRPIADRMLDPIVATFVAMGIGPNGASVLAFISAGAGAVAFYLGSVHTLWYVVGALCVVLNGAFDLLDGALARTLDIASEAGDVLDHTLDRYADILFIGGLAAGIEAFGLGFLAVTGVVMTSYLGTQAQAVGYGRLYAGVLGRADRLALIVAAAIVMAVVSTPIYGLTVIGWLLAVFGVVGHLTAVQRFIVIYRGV